MPQPCLTPPPPLLPPPQSQAPGCAPVVNCNVNGKYAFVEFRTPEYATAALQLDGQVTLMGNQINIKRPAGGWRVGRGGRVCPGAAPLQARLRRVRSAGRRLRRHGTALAGADAGPQPPPAPLRSLRRPR
jgi:hypothetical protein